MQGVSRGSSATPGEELEELSPILKPSLSLANDDYEEREAPPTTVPTFQLSRADAVDSCDAADSDDDDEVPPLLLATPPSRRGMNRSGRARSPSKHLGPAEAELGLSCYSAATEAEAVSASPATPSAGKFRVTYAGPPPASPCSRPTNGFGLSASVSAPALKNRHFGNGWAAAAGGSGVGQNDTTINSFADFVVHSGGGGGSGGRKSSSSLTGTASSVWRYMPFLVNQKRRRRLMGKNGDCNISHKRVENVRLRFLADIYTSLVDLKWRYVLLICNTSFVVSWLFFGLLWWIICLAHGDFDVDPARRPERPCVMEVRGFATALLYSIETQHTIGYGGRQLTDECPEAMLLLMIQSLFGMIMQALITGAMFAKLALPKKRAETLMFSRHAVVCERDGSLCLMFRIGDMRRSHLVGASIRAVLVTRRASQDGDLVDQTSIRLGMDRGPNRIMIMWPTIILHRIDERSPFWEMSKADFEQGNFELIVILEGVIEATGMTTQARTSYLPSEVLWGHRLERLMTFQKEDGRYNVDYSRFHVTVPVPTPSCSARETYESSLAAAAAAAAAAEAVSRCGAAGRGQRAAQCAHCGCCRPRAADDRSGGDDEPESSGDEGEDDD